MMRSTSPGSWSGCTGRTSAASGPGNQRRYSNQILAGIELALWDAVGKALGQPVHRLMGGAVRDEVAYFGFIQGDGPDEVARACARARRPGLRGPLPQGRPRRRAGRREHARGADGDRGRRLRVDANEAWDTLTARRMIALLAPFGLEFVEQPRPPTAPAHWPGSADEPGADRGRPAGDDATGRVRDLPARSGRPDRAGDPRDRWAARVAQGGRGGRGCGPQRLPARRLRERHHHLRQQPSGGHRSPISTTATRSWSSSWRRTSWPRPPSPRATPGCPVLEGPGLGFELDRDAVGRAAERYRTRGR